MTENGSHTALAAGGLARLALAGCLLALAALVVLSAGVGPGGALGSLFGFAGDDTSKRALTSRAVAQRPVDGTALPASLRRRITHHAPARRRAAPPRHDPARRPALRQPPHQSPGNTAPAPAPPAPAPPAAPPAPAPPSGVVHGVSETVKRAADPLPQPAQPIVGQAVETVTRICTVLGGCP